jgi:hypothetical protein
MIKTLTCHLIQASEVGAFFEDFFFHLVIVHLYELLFILHNLVSFEFFFIIVMDCLRTKKI